MDVNEIVYQWHGERTTDGLGWVEHYAGGGKTKRVPPRDLTVADVAKFSPEQRQILASETGQRLYVLVGDDGTDAVAARERAYQDAYTAVNPDPETEPEAPVAKPAVKPKARKAKPKAKPAPKSDEPAVEAAPAPDDTTTEPDVDGKDAEQSVDDAPDDSGENGGE